MITKIIAAYDASKESKKAYLMAIDLAVKYSAEIIVVSVARPPEPPIAVEMEAILEAAGEYYRMGFEALQKEASQWGLQPRFEIRVGHPAEQIVFLANEQGAEMIVMGHRGGGSFIQRWRLGSVARRVMQYAHCTVVIVR
jgi:nucleotide-binding universal stress UspA family protein